MTATETPPAVDPGAQSEPQAAQGIDALSLTIALSLLILVVLALVLATSC